MSGVADGACFNPEEVAAFRDALESAWESLSNKEQSETTRSELAEEILRLAAAGERDHDRLRLAAVLRAKSRAVWLKMAS